MHMQRTQRAIALAVLDRERDQAELDRIIGDSCIEAVKALAREDVVIRSGERVWASPCASRLDELGLVAV